jgi:hypothetical protein
MKIDKLDYQFTSLVKRKPIDNSIEHGKIYVSLGNEISAKNF